MHPVLQKTIGGLSREYYIRNLIFGALIGMLWFYLLSHGNKDLSVLWLWPVVIVNTLLYPYSRFVYESVMGFILGKNVFIMNAVFLLFAKLITMAMCWSAAIFMAPIGFAYLYYHHSKPNPNQ